MYGVGEHMILVTGATGKVGRNVVEELREAGVAVRALAREPAAAEFDARAGVDVEVMRGDLTDPRSLVPALRGVDAVFLLWPFLTTKAAPPVLEVIGEHTRRIVYLSSQGVRDDGAVQADPINAFHAEMERLIERSGLERTVLRPTGFASNALGWAEQIRERDVVRQPFGDLARPLIHERDIAAVAARALAQPGHRGRTYVLTGPRSLTTREQTDAIAEAIGRPLAFEEMPMEEARASMLAQGLPAEVADGMLAAHAEMMRSPEPVNRKVEELTGAPARTFREWAADHADEFR
ncbi:NAD(P)H-binding protein [Streptomyces sp. NPDC051776]|uniref:NAD(P)H-binding protein n=1 Tax=Streptomyces sp. NPDC051776 TaxID=3155414 RepID=UPI003435F932